MAKIIDVILPTTANVPGASDLNFIQFIDGYLANVTSPEEQEFTKMATGIFAGVALAAAGKESAADLTAEDIDVQLNKFLRATPEDLATRGEAFNAYLAGLEDGTAGAPPIEGVCQNYLFNLRSLAIRAFEGNAIIGKEHLAYAQYQDNKRVVLIYKKRQAEKSGLYKLRKYSAIALASS